MAEFLVEVSRQTVEIDHPLGVQIDAIPGLIKLRDAGTQFGQSKGHRIAKRIFRHRFGQRVARGSRRGRARLSHFHMND